MSTALMTAETDATEEVRVTVDVPRDCSDWWELRALRRKQETGASRPSKSVVIVELIRAEMKREAEAAAAARTPVAAPAPASRKKGGKGGDEGGR